jgi:hypothetical protein
MIGLKMVLEWADDWNALKPVGVDGDTDMYDYAILGITDDGSLVYSKELMIQILNKHSDMDYEESAEFLEFNCFKTYIGKSTYIGEVMPIFVNQHIN